jgi:hypothetical protein
LPHGSGPGELKARVAKLTLMEAIHEERSPGTPPYIRMNGTAPGCAGRLAIQSACTGVVSSVPIAPSGGIYPRPIPELGAYD